MGIERPSESHPFFHNRPIPHRSVTSQEIGNNVEILSESATTIQSHSRKRKSRPLTERASNTHLPQPVIIDIPNDAMVSSDQQTMEKTPKKKVLKLNSNGKLLSSPSVDPSASAKANAVTATLISPNATKTTVKRARGRPPKPKSASLVAKIGYSHAGSDERVRIGEAINELLGSSQDSSSPNRLPTSKNSTTPKKSTHPFFVGKVKHIAGAQGTVNGSDQDSEAPMSNSSGVVNKGSPKADKPPAWKDVVFSANRNLSQGNQGLPAPWPSLDIQNVHGLQRDQALRFNVNPLSFQTYKSKSCAIHLPAEEGVVYRASRAYSGSANLCAIRKPARTVLSGEEMSSKLKEKMVMDSVHMATRRLNSSLTSTLTAFDQGKCDQSSWTTKSSPSRAEEVLQPGREAVLLRDWIQNMAVTSVEGGQPAERVKAAIPLARKRGRPKRPDCIDDFIVSSEDEEAELLEVDQSPKKSSPFIDEAKRTVLRAGALTSSPKKGRSSNVILISGPAGCGKTASVYAVAKELGFEVFELHPGTRRGAKEILEKVGDMTQNHLVQHGSGEDWTEELAAPPIDDAAVQNEIASGKQQTMNGFFQSQVKAAPKAKGGRKRKAVLQDDQKEANTSKKPKQAQKQSLILLEEVDHVFEDDKSFWSGVTSLISQSKRPIILTCNDESALPLEDLPLHGILRYTQPPEDLATDYLLTLAATEGHELERDAVSYLYRSQKHDLRATITELDFWCQMGVGSCKAGLDWMLDRTLAAQNDPKTTRVFSTKTYLRGMGLTSQQTDTDPDQLVFDACQQLDLPIDIWCIETDRNFPESTTLADASIRSELYSALDLCDQPSDPITPDPSDLQLRISISLLTRLSANPPTASSIISAHATHSPQPNHKPLARSTLHEILLPLTRPKATFPPPQGRLAPTIDSASTSTLTTDVAPYIRSIVAFEQKWGLAAPVLTKKRNTRASEKMQEGHFPKNVNKEFVLMTGGEGWGGLWDGESWEKVKRNGGREGDEEMIDE